MSVTIYVMRKDIPPDCAYYVCKPWDEYPYSYSEWDTGMLGVTVELSYFIQDPAYREHLRSTYPRLYPDYLDGKTGRQIGGTLTRTINRCRRRELHGRDERTFRRQHQSGDRTDDTSRLALLLTGIRHVAQALEDHPDWRVTVES